MDLASKFIPMLIALLAFAAVVAVVMTVGWLISRGSNKFTDALQGYWFILPVMLMLAVGLLYPGLLTIRQSFGGADGATGFSMSNYVDIFRDPEMRKVVLNTLLWVALVPTLSTLVGMVYAILVDRSRVEAFAKALVFLPMAISMVGASIIWKFVYDYRPAGRDQIGLFNAILDGLGMEPVNFMLSQPWNNFWLIIVMVWIQAGFAMTVISAAIKAIPDDIIEAAKIDGTGAWNLFRFITLPSIRGSLVVVLTTIAIGTLKVFDIVRTMTGGQFGTSVIANEFYNKAFRYSQYGSGAALAVLLFIMVIPIVVYNVIQLRRS
ncbi:sugar ABC transporter permease [Aestuariimicrobium sp. p3-SID1156]|uniref:carbohydrate ABC transporter permease n=1 Tax=Aestuariimicrobium sp. p3-SID1156 TaxID=2916038 RepID=UPI00223B0861|nr:sugar ABC transporter permease [Aestuariimicrobium sp. p3-SID1156]MCT1459964.1 sugar ABC transporter permease [Aestuariimicrobium sp. p3-SID1156]